ncbi:hypothetical protein PENSPDRAFT_691049 [Peniophora sp. CONT]|nr:hypothetical protein PENSPDRAFT_691049 [Peniophora sp. CONT]
MFSDHRILPAAAQRALFAYCPYDDVSPAPGRISLRGDDVGCLVDNIVNSCRRMHVHPDDFVLVLNDEVELDCKARLPVDPQWSSGWVAQVVHMTCIDYRRADVFVKWAYSSEELCRLERRGQIDPSVGSVEFGPWARVLSDHTDVIPSSSIASVLDLSTRKSNERLYLKKWAIKWNSREDAFFPTTLTF